MNIDTNVRKALFKIWKGLAIVLIPLFVVFPDETHLDGYGELISIICLLGLAWLNYKVFDLYKKKFGFDSDFDNIQWIKGKKGFSYMAVAIACAIFLFAYVLK